MTLVFFIQSEVAQSVPTFEKLIGRLGLVPATVQSGEASHNKKWQARSGSVTGSDRVEKAEKHLGGISSSIGILIVEKVSTCARL